MFVIQGIYIGEDCEYTKCLKKGMFYSLEDKMPVDFFAPNVCITSIVGQNGAGKSSL